MGAVRRIAVCGPAAPPVSWDRYADLGQWSTWAPQISGVDADARALQPGLTGQVRTSVGLSVPFVVTDVDARGDDVELDRLGRSDPAHPPPRRSPPDGTGARASLAIEGPALVVAAYAPLAWWALRNLVR